MTTFSIQKNAIPKIIGNPILATYFEERSHRLANELTELSKAGGLIDQDFYRIKLLSEERKTAFNLDAMGVYTDVITVEDAPFAHPRAYITYPTIYFDTQGKYIDSSVVWVDVPSGYNNIGDTITPKILSADEIKASRVDDKYARKTLDAAFGSPFAEPELSIMNITPRGTTIPAGYVWNETVKNTFDYGDKAVFVFETADSDSAADIFNIVKTKKLREQAQFIPYGESHLVIAFNRGAEIPESLALTPQMDVKPMPGCARTMQT